ncbi:hypothetical protein E0I61_09665 [Flavobacterium ranwuense]|uniref:Lipoprotein n=1 Tax=Flavobacterium ranwuense TaxID=2541725 RepID=A0ABY2DRK7_9FLAO|nr:hypothetical protein [Flavobacterium ranwuense]TDE29414.1 hypothetical protein E0I61_09665 [Flavobacterium ranwuense]
MKIYKRLFAICLIILIFVSCNKTEEIDDKADFFLSEIRPIFFEKLNFDSQNVKNNISTFLSNFKEIYGKQELNYLSGIYTSDSDLENFRLSKQYYSFYITALVSAYLDGYISFNDISGGKEIGLFSGARSNQNNFEVTELLSMMTRAEEIARQAYTLNGYNDRAYGFFVLVNQTEKRLRSTNHLSNPFAHKLATDFTGYNLQDYTQVPVWNLLMPLVVLTDYNDPLNTFQNPEMEKVLNTYNTKLIVPGTLPSIGGKYPEILGPLYKFDVNLKKIDWMLTNNTLLSSTQINDLDMHLGIMNTIVNYIETHKSALLNTWRDKSTFQLRKDKLNEIKSFRQNLASYPKPILHSFINSKDFKKAYQCYSCHANSGL